MSKKKMVSDLLYEFAGLIDQQTAKRKQLEYTETARERAEKEYEELSKQVTDLENKLISLIADE